MALALPDELLREILQPSLIVEDALFADTGSKSPFSKTEISASRVLLVCKRWMRVCTPWLYETVVIRSKAQASALNQALTRSPSFGAYIKKLRVEGGYDVSAVVDISPNITDLCFSLAIWCNDDASAIVSVLEYVDPRRVILTLYQQLRNAKVEQVLLTLCIMLGRWTNVTTFLFPQPAPGQRGYWRERKADVSWAAIADAIALREEQTTVVFSAGPDNVTMGCLAPNIAISKILIPDIDRTDRDKVWRNKFANRLACAFSDNPLPPCSPPGAVPATTSVVPDVVFHNPFYKPLGSASPDIRKQILRDILDFAFDESQRPSAPMAPGYLWIERTMYDSHDVSRFCQVSLEFERITLELVSDHVALISPDAVAQFQAVLDKYPECGARVQEVFAHDAFPELETILSSCTRLRALHIGAGQHLWRGYTGRKVPRSIIRTLAQAAGGSLQVLRLGLCNGMPIDAGVFGAFTALESLTWTIGFTVNQPEGPIALAQLTTLRLPGRRGDPFIDGLAHFDLPNISEVHYTPQVDDCTAFLEKHGSKLKTAVLYADWDERLFELAPNLEVLTLHSSTSDSRAFQHRSHQHLHTINLEWKTDKRSIGDWKRLVEVLAASVSEIEGRGSSRRVSGKPAYPALRTVNARKLGGWPASEREIAKSPWPAVAEGLMEHGIALLDSSGGGWRPRL
ncbi:hypothetical protein AURDEDRAFT_185247 [Auricularia subglabra TFB-10046 SS5]|nr:hypothetical protein AURDEDRAFT_185247 [Auricularia subglabra TFB-10046 SS5]